MNFESVGRNLEGLNLASVNKPFSERPQKSGMDNFDTIQYKSKNDGKTYIAKKTYFKARR